MGSEQGAVASARAGGWFRLRDLGIMAKVGVACLVLTLLGGAAVAGWYLRMHHDSRDERAGLTIDDIKAHYHGIVSRAPLLVALEKGHPDELASAEDLPQAERAILLSWLRSDRISDDYDNLELGANAPAEILAARCVTCHSRRATGEGAHPALPLEFFDDVRSAAFSRDVQPVGTEILAASTHTHALSLATLGLVMSALGLATGWPRWLMGLLVLLCGAGLLGDIGGWWLTRTWVQGAWLVVGAGFVFNAAVGLLGLAALADLVMPRRD
ncbi:MAG: hypothetical protein ACF8R7_16050 [Phycisphaerales bacterium JB039]